MCAALLVPWQPISRPCSSSSQGIFFQGFSACEGQKPSLAHFLGSFLVLVLCESICKEPLWGTLWGECSASWVGAADPHQDRGKCPCLQPPLQDVRACAPWLVLTAILRYYAQLWLAQVPFCFSHSWTSNLLPFP